MKRFLLAGALLLAVATLDPITRFVTFWARCAKRRHQEAMIYLAYERGLITKAEIDRMLKQVDELTVAACPSSQNGKGNGNGSTAKTSER